MANYIIGDIQGCLDELQLLLSTAQFDAKQDTLWFAGDLVARGPKSLETLRFIKSLGLSARVCLGNHDLHLIAVSLGLHKAKAKDKTQPILDADDREELLYWLRQQPLLLEHDEFVVCHAGISPQWSLDQAREFANQIQTQLQGEHWQQLITQMYSNQPDYWHPKLSGIELWRYTINAYTRMRFCHTDGHLDMACKLPPEEVEPTSLIPWFKHPQRQTLGKTVLFGHWAALGGYVSDEFIGLDTGCVWGGELTMIRWEDKKLFAQPAIKN
ncbi:symmetrical bis(5'-nucleosyl)-tetraphosphatase [Vibrio hippocampi]|uniref:Bis(5'-nucleosyl)-tetraphosphatase, symmetrical n=1 Tax=Vibrio hippocampi TaxID=654686 RepID=A0ABN8DL51_9VIBR|nr:symmetrical bis(5'-nucleosyl)-tetraphosphatase [Vibrio hippocampi]CAH0526838.1 Bis(5'-nucleosyl)-tetraphosphatase, symmetrical [Vibrio hippocampi]